MARTELHQTLANQQKTINALRHQAAKQDLVIAFIARVAGLTDHVAAISKQADAANPAQPVPDPASEGAAETTQQARTPEAQDNVDSLGETPGANGRVPAEATDTPLKPGVSIPTEPFNNLQDVTAPVSGTETHVPNDQTRLEVDVRVGDPDNPQVAFPWTLPGSTAGNRTMASLVLARLRMRAGIADGSDDISIAGSIEADASLADAAIQGEINVLSKVVKAASAGNSGGQRKTSLVPRSASVGRTTPSLADNSAPIQTTSASTFEDTADADLFM